MRRLLMSRQGDAYAWFASMLVFVFIPLSSLSIDVTRMMLQPTASGGFTLKQVGDLSTFIPGLYPPPSPLEKIQPEGWLSEYTTDLLNLLRVLGSPKLSLTSTPFNFPVF